MAYKPEYLTNLKRIIVLAQTNIGQATAEFELFIEKLDISKYSSSEWPDVFRKEIYKFGELFSYTNIPQISASNFIEVIEKNPEASSKKEIVDFIYSEILWNFFEAGSLYVSELLKTLIKRYPMNPEFHNNYSHFLLKNGNYEQAIEEAFFALRMDPDNSSFKEACFNKCKNYFDYLLKHGKTEKAEGIRLRMKRLVNDSNMSYVFMNIITFLRDRIEDHELINKRLENMVDLSKNVAEKERGKIIEIMGFFVAILGLVFININLATSALDFQEILKLMAGMAIILTFFAILISILFNPQKKFTFKEIFGDKRFIIIFILIIFFFLYYLITTSPKT